MSDRMTVRELSEDQLRDKRALVRVDYNVPIENARVGDDARIRATLPTIEYLRGRGAAIVLISHLGRPEGQTVPELSLRPVAERLGELLGREVAFVEDTTGEAALEATRALEAGAVLLLENTRFDPGETKNDDELAARLAELGDVYVNDAFGAAHRAHASTAGVTRFLKPAVAGLLMERELQHLGTLLENPDHPFVTILGGAKVSGKIDLIENLLDRVDRLCVGGAMACTFFKAMDLEVGESLVEEDMVGVAGDLIERAGDRLLLPRDAVVATELDAEASTESVDREAIPGDRMVADIGPAAARAFADACAEAATILWNGPPGVFELAPFSEGTRTVARAIAEATGRGATSIVGGGDTAAAVAALGLRDQMTHVSTGGGATLEFLAGKSLPGVEALTPRG